MNVPYTYSFRIVKARGYLSSRVGLFWLACVFFAVFAVVSMRHWARLRCGCVQRSHSPNREGGETANGRKAAITGKLGKKIHLHSRIHAYIHTLSLTHIVLQTACPRE